MDAPKRYHSVQLDKSRCKGCTNCLMHCPTEAIRVRDGRAHIIAERCIDCGECIRICDYHAKVAVTDKFDTIKAFRYAIALPAPRAGEDVLSDYRATGLTLREHPLALLRARLRRERVMDSSQLREVRHGRGVHAAGLVTQRQGD